MLLAFRCKYRVRLSAVPHPAILDPFSPHTKYEGVVTVMLEEYITG